MRQLARRVRDLRLALVERRHRQALVLRDVRRAADRARLRVRAPLWVPRRRRLALGAVLGFAAQAPVFGAVALLQPPPQAIARAEARRASAVPLGFRSSPEVDPVAAVAPSSDCDNGQACRPIPIVVPFTHADSTNFASDRRISQYACAPDIPQGGAEVWFELEIEVATTIVASIAEDPTDGVDVDLHLLTSADPASCVARGDAWIEAALAPGRYLLVADTCSVLGFEQPGPFLLTVIERAPEFPARDGPLGPEIPADGPPGPEIPADGPLGRVGTE